MAAIDRNPTAPFGAVSIFRLVSAFESAILVLVEAWREARLRARVAALGRRRRAALGLPDGAERLDVATLERLLAPGRD